MSVRVRGCATRCGSRVNSRTPTSAASTTSARHTEIYYLSMEYVDGEDLAALLKRIGRVPIDKGIEIARKLCAGLAAAHAKGVLHRDFKPANIMIDSHGEVRIMDFGLAAIADQLDTSDAFSGTPAYMAPEQLAGTGATRQSDLYALGLVLYELFTGKPPFAGKDLQELQRQRADTPKTTPSTLIPDISPRLERAILRCLEPEPNLRPASALEVAVSLPGGDPLAEALAAGETPSPDLLAASGPREALRPRTAIALLACVAAVFVTAIFLAPRAQTVARLPLRHPPEVLTEKAREVIRALGYTGDPVDSASGFRNESGWLESVRAAMPANATRQTWTERLSLAPYPVAFWYRQGASALVPPLTPIDHHREGVAEQSNAAGVRRSRRRFGSRWPFAEIQSGISWIRARGEFERNDARLGRALQCRAIRHPPVHPGGAALDCPRCDRPTDRVDRRVRQSY